MEETVIEKKDVTIRNVDATLYDNFVRFARIEGKSTGEFFDFVFRAVIEQGHSAIRIMRNRYRPFNTMPEIISKMDKLTISRRDLEQIKGKNTYYFCKIRELIFEEDIDGQLLSETIHAIGKCRKIIFKGNVPKLIKLGLILKGTRYNYPKNPEKLKDITIRKVSADIYDAFLAKSKEEGKTTGEFFSEYIAATIPSFDMFQTISMLVRETKIFPLIISKEKELIIEDKDLTDVAPKKVIFYDIENLIFDKNLKEESFEKYVGKIINCNKVTIPQNVPRLLTLARINNVKELIWGEQKIKQ